MPARTDADICNLALLHVGVNQRIGSLADKSAAGQACGTMYAEVRRQVLSSFRWPFAIKRVQLVPFAGDAYDTTRTYGLGDPSQIGSNVFRSLQAANLNHQPGLDASAAWWTQLTRDGYKYACVLADDVLNPIAAWDKASPVSSALAPFQFDDSSSRNLRNPRSDERNPFSLENLNDGSDDSVLLTDLPTPILKYVAEITNPAAFPAPFVETLAWHLAAVLATGLRGDEKKAKECGVMAARTLGDAFISVMRDQQQDSEPVSEFEAAREGGL